MRISRNFAIKIHYILDEWIPPVLRDKKWFMWFPMKLLFKDKAELYFEFKDKSINMSEKEFSDIYEMTSAVHLERDTDLNDGCVAKITNSIYGESVLEAGCGRAYLANILSTEHSVTACDIVISDELVKKYPKIHFQKENLERLSFEDNQFDTVICTNTLEHLQDISAAIKELRRVTKNRLIIVVPKQRPYLYTFDLHLHFFPYAHILLGYLRTDNDDSRYSLELIQGDWYYQEEKRPSK